MARDAIYCRYSSTNQDGGVSIETQLEVCHKLANDKPLEFIDRAVSGRTMHREAFRKMLDAAEQGKFERLIVYKWDRFGRNAETHATIADLEDMGIKVTSATEGDDFLARGVGLLVSEDYSRKLSQRVIDSMRVRFRQNKSYMGGTIPYGYKLVRGPDNLNRLAIDKTEASVVRLIFKLYTTESIGTRKIAKRLTALGHHPRTGRLHSGEWGWTTINRILQSQTYLGIVLYGKYTERMDRRTGKIKKTPNPNFETNLDSSLRIISDEVFARAKARLERGNFTKLPRHVRPFSNLITCSCCGSVMYTRHSGFCGGRKINNPTYFIVCGRRDRLGVGDEGCRNPNRRLEVDLVTWVQESMKRALARKDEVIARAVVLAEKQLNASDGRREKLTKELSSLEQGIARLRRMFRGSELSEVETRGLISQIAHMEEEREALNSSIKQLGTETSVDSRKLLQEIKHAMEEAQESILNVANVAAFNSAVQRFVGPLVALPDGKLAPAEAHGYPRAGARGTDSAAHRGALTHPQGRTIAVLGSGVDKPYPPENAALFDQIATRGAVVSEFPLGTPPLAENFPRRNRIISGMSRGVLVTEAAERSGALITARQAGEDQGRPVFALPGRVDNPMAAGPLQLLRDGALLAAHLDDILPNLGPLPDDAHVEGLFDGASPDVPDETTATLPAAVPTHLTDRQQLILNRMGADSSSVDQLIEITGLEPGAVLQEMTLLTLMGLVKRADGQTFARKR